MPYRAPDCDLHPYFRDPDKARAILDTCIAECVRQGKTQVRVVHGKGKGDFRKMIHSHLEKHPDVEGFVECDPMHGGSGATWVHIARESPDETRPRDPLARYRTRPAAPIRRWLIYAVVVALSFIVFTDWLLRIAVVLFLFWVEYRIVGKSYPDATEGIEHRDEDPSKS